MEEVGETIRCVDDIEEMIIPLLERLQRGISRRRTRVATGLGVTTQEPLKIHESTDENKEEGVSVV
jgi:hypothetical protein